MKTFGAYLSSYLLDENYKGKMGGYIVDLENGVTVKMEYGVRGFDIPVTVIVKNGLVVEIVAETKNKL